jgi:hypothetical protein
MFDPQHYRAEHEPMAGMTNQLVVDTDRGDLHPDVAKSILEWRDRYLDLDFDASHPLGMIPLVLLKAVPDAKFIVTIRDPALWIRSRIKYHYWVQPPDWVGFRQHFWYDQNQSFQKQDLYLSDYGLCSVASYFAAYEQQYTSIIDALKFSGCSHLIIRTEDLTLNGPRRIAHLLDIPVETVRPQYKNRSVAMQDISGPLTHEWLRDQAHEYCPIAYRLWSDS